MTRISTRGRYALRAMVDVAQHGENRSMRDPPTLEAGLRGSNRRTELGHAEEPVRSGKATCRQGVMEETCGSITHDRPDRIPEAL
jgi:hypothetical protein